MGAVLALLGAYGSRRTLTVAKSTSGISPTEFWDGSLDSRQECRRILDLPRIQKRLKGREVQARQVLAAGARTLVSGDAAVLAGGFAGVLVASAAEFLAALGED